MIQQRHRSIFRYLVKPVLVLLLLIGIFSLIWLRSNFVSIEYRISELESRKTELLRETKALMAGKASALSIVKVEKKAITNLGLVFPDRRNVFYVDARKAGPYSASAVSKEGEVR